MPDTRKQPVPKGPGRVLDVLNVVASSNRPISGGAIATRLGIPRSTTSLLLRALNDRQAVSIEAETGLYTPGPVLFELGLALDRRSVVVRAARHELERLAEETAELVYIGIRAGFAAVYLDKVEGTRGVHLAISLGVPRAIHSTALGKLFLADDAALLQRVLEQQGLKPLTSRTITDSEALKQALESVRQDGYADSEGENVEGIMSLAAPIRTIDGDLIAGVCMSWLLAEGLEKKPAYVKRLKAAAVEIGKRLLPMENGSVNGGSGSRQGASSRRRPRADHQGSGG